MLLLALLLLLLLLAALLLFPLPSPPASAPAPEPAPTVSSLHYVVPRFEERYGTIIVVDSAAQCAYVPGLLPLLDTPVEIADAACVLGETSFFSKMRAAVLSAASAHGRVRLVDVSEHDDRSVRHTDSARRSGRWEAAAARALLLSRFRHARVMRADTLLRTPFGKPCGELFPIGGCLDLDTSLFMFNRLEHADLLDQQVLSGDLGCDRIFEQYVRRTPAWRDPGIPISIQAFEVTSSRDYGTHITRVSENEEALYRGAWGLMLGDRPAPRSTRLFLRKSIEDAWELLYSRDSSPPIR